MNVLDENIQEDQRQVLGKWRIPVKRIGFDLFDKGIKDEHLLDLLRGQNESPSLRETAGSTMCASPIHTMPWSIWRLSRAMSPRSCADTCGIRNSTRTPSEWGLSFASHGPAFS